MNNDRWNLKTFTGGSEESNGFLGKALNSRLDIIGAGPSGLVLALSLRKNGIPVRIIDKEPLLRLGERGAGIQPRSLELHHTLGTISDVLSYGKPANNWYLRVHDLSDNQKPPRITPLAPFVEPQIHTPYTSTILLGQQHHEKILRSHLEKMGTVVEFGSELKGFEQFEDHVTVQIVRRSLGEESLEEAQVPWLVGTDGAHSIVRKTLSLSFLGETREADEMLVGDIKVRAGLDDHGFWERWVGPSNMVLLRPSGQDEDVYNFILGGPNIDYGEISTSSEEFAKLFYSLTKRTEILFGDIVWVSKYRPNIRMVDTLRVGRIFIAGDAAHCHTPAGGQGMNSSIQDSFNLGWKLSLVYKGYASAALLDSYQEERLPIIAEMLGKTTELFKQIVERGGDISQVRRSTDLTQLGVNYRGSSIIGEDDIRNTTLKVSGYNTESETAACPGDRAPEVPSMINVTGEHKRETLFGIFSPCHHSVLVFTKKYDQHSALALSSVIKRLPEKTVCSVLILPSESNVNEVCAVYDKVFIDSGGHVYLVYGLPDDRSYFVIVRPDGVVGARVHEVDGVERYFQKIFSDVIRNS